MSRVHTPLPRLRGVAAYGSQIGWEAAVILPARNEEKRIAACIHALADAIERTELRVGVMLLVNNTIDETAQLGSTVLAARNIPGLVFDLQFDPGTDGLGRIRDLGMQAALRIPRGPRYLLTTDSDSRVSPEWVAANLEELQQADVVFGTVLPDPDELDELHPFASRHGLTERHCLQLAARLAARLDPRPHDPEPTHRMRSGASLALTRAAFSQLDGLPWSRVGEGPALAARAEALDLRIRHAAAPRVVSSCRLAGRSEGGAACAWRARCTEPDPLCDPWLEPAETLVRRYRTKGRLRACWPDPAAVRRLAHQVLGPGPQPDPADFSAFGSYWQHLEAEHPLLRRQRLRQSDARRELPRFAAALETLEAETVEAQPPDCPTRMEDEVSLAG